MKKSLLILSFLITFFGYSQSGLPKTAIPPVTSDMIDPTYASVIESAGNSAITLASNITDITNAGANAFIEFREDIVLLANYTPPSNQTWIFTTGALDASTFLLNYNGLSIFFNGKKKGLDLSECTTTGTVVLENSILNASNIGLIDDDTFDNWQGIKNALHIVNQNSNHLFFNKQSATAIYYFQVYNDDYGTPFFANGYGNSNTLIVGDGYDYVKISSQSGVQLRTYAANEDGSAAFVAYNTKGYEIFNNHFIGDRNTHLYDQEIKITVAATSAGNVRLRIIEHPDYQDDFSEKEINKVIPLTLSNLATNLQEVIDYVNTDIDFTDWTASAIDANTIRLRTVGGQYSSVFFTNETAGATVSATLKLYEWGHCIVQGSRAVNGQIHHNTIEFYHGDAIAKSEQGNGTISLDFEDFTNGNIDEDGVVTNGDNGYWYLTVNRNMPTPHPWFTMTNNSGQTLSMLHQKYWMVYYDESDNFIEKSPTLTPFDIYEYPSNFKKYKIIIEDYGADMSTNFTYFINSPSIPYGGNISFNRLVDNRRHGITNVLSDQVVEYNYFDRNSGVSPQIDLNVEDWGFKVKGQVVRFNTFNTTNVANISLKGAYGVKVYGNFFNQGAYQINTGDYDAKTTAILTSYARNADIYENQFTNKSSYIDILTNSHNNTYTNSELNIRSGSPTIKDETFINSTINDGAPGGFVTEGLGGKGIAHFENNVFYINDGWGNQPLIDEANSIAHKNIKYYFNHKASNRNVLTDEALRNVYLNSTSTNYLRADRATSNDGGSEGSYDGTYVYGSLVNPANLHSVGWAQYACNNTNFDLSSPLKIENGYEKSFKISNGKTTGWLWLEMGEFPTDGIGTFETVTIENVDINVPARIDINEGHLNNSQYGGTQLQNLFRTTTDLNINLYAKNVHFNSADASTGLFMFLGHRGTTELEDCTFTHPTGDTIDFSLTGAEKTVNVHAGVNTGAISIINPKLNNVTILGAKLLFSYPNPNCPSYADNATALAAIGEGWYYKNTTSGEFEVTHL